MENLKNIKIVKDKILVKKIESESKIILLNDGKLHQASTAMIIGDNIKEIDIKVGDTIIHDKGSEEIIINDIKYNLIMAYNIKYIISKL